MQSLVNQLAKEWNTPPLKVKLSPKPTYRFRVSHDRATLEACPLAVREMSQEDLTHTITHELAHSHLNHSKRAKRKLAACGVSWVALILLGLSVGVIGAVSGLLLGGFLALCVRNRFVKTHEMEAEREVGRRAKDSESYPKFLFEWVSDVKRPLLSITVEERVSSFKEGVRDSE